MGGRERHVEYRVLSTRTIVLGALGLAVIGVAAATGLLLAFGGASETDKVGLEVIKTAGTIVVGTGGAAALWLAARKQRTSEIAMRHQERVAQASEADAAERRVTELYTKAVEQLGSDKAAVRLGGMYALERLAQNTPDQRQTIVNVLCAYLRMPYTPPTDDGPDQEARQQELQVRQTAQRILTAHLVPGPNEQPWDSFWPDIDLDLTSAELVDFSLTGCRLRSARFNRAVFTESARFHRTEFTSSARFSGAEFRVPAIFTDARFNLIVWFDGAVFDAGVRFTGAQARAGEPGRDRRVWPEGYALGVDEGGWCQLGTSSG